MAAENSAGCCAHHNSSISSITISQLCRETILGYLFWSLFTGLVPMIWFYPLNELDITGYEGFAVLYLSPILLGPASVRRLLQNRWSMAIVRVAVLASFASFQAGTTLQRLIILASGCGALMWQLTGCLWSPAPLQRTLTAWGLMLGFLAYLSSRIWFMSFVPAWWDQSANKVVIAMGALATFGKITAGEDGLKSEDRLLPAPLRPYWLLTGVGFGSLLYITQALFGEVSLITRWVVKGYPDPGPSPNPWGGVILVALFLGLLLSSYQGLVQSSLWWLVGCAGLAALLYLPTWQGFAGGVVFAVYLMSLWPELLDRVTSCPPARTLVVAMLTYIALMLFSVWTVAYNFVPGGVYTREHTDWLIGFVAVTLGLGILTGRRLSRPSRSSFVLIQHSRMPVWTVTFLAVVIVFSGLCGFVARFNPPPNHPKKIHPKADFTAAIWTYHFGYDNRGWPSLERSASLLNNTNADVITLLESDASKPFLGNNDLSMWLAERLDMYVDFGPSTRDHTWGNLILSRYPIVKSTHHLLPSPHGELAPAITATIDVGGHLVDFVVTHMGNDRDVLDRELQAKFLANELKTAKNPAVFLGYVTSKPGSRDYKKLTVSGGAKDIDDTDKDRWCEYILYKNLIRLGYARVSHGGLSDTEVQLARFRIPEDLNNYKDHERIVTDPKQIKHADRFTTKFGSFHDGHNWMPNHNYHMSTPKYFLP